MKKLNIVSIFLMSLFAFVGCGKEEGITLKAEYGKLAFAFDKSELDTNSLKEGTVYSLDNVSAAVVTIEKDGVALEGYISKQIALTNWGSGVYTTADIQLLVGADYSLTKFELKNAEGKIIYATPLEGSELADKVEKPLPITFDITKDESTPVNVEVISTEEREVAQFGYAQFVVTDKTDNGGDPVVEGEMIDNGDGTITDSRDNHVYKIVTIGDQVWMAENLAYLPSVNLTSDISDDVPYYYVYDYFGEDVDEAKTQSNYLLNGVLYNGPAASIAAPEGWHLPTEEEFLELELYLGMSEEDAADKNNYRGVHGQKLKSVNGWSVYSAASVEGNNESGFNALAAGELPWAYGTYKGKNDKTTFWSSTRDDYKDYKLLYSRTLSYSDAGVMGGTSNMKCGYSIRLVKDK